MFQKTVSVVRSSSSGERWRDISYQVFDVPAVVAPIEERFRQLREIVKHRGSDNFKMVDQTPCQGHVHLKETLAKVVALGAEGLMIREPRSLYEAKRSHTILKVKPFKDAEAVVVGRELGKGRNKGRMGALIVKMPNGKTFNIGTGFSDHQRVYPPANGASITYRYTELTDDGIPKCASFVAVRDYE
jgi:DNA ligase-1